jgi:hypothetical protein
MSKGEIPRAPLKIHRNPRLRISRSGNSGKSLESEGISVENAKKSPPQDKPNRKFQKIPENPSKQKGSPSKIQRNPGRVWKYSRDGYFFALQGGGANIKII